MQVTDWGTEFHDALNAVIFYLYHGKYTGIQYYENVDFIRHWEVYVLACKFEIGPLREKAATDFWEIVKVPGKVGLDELDHATKSIYGARLLLEDDDCLKKAVWVGVAVRMEDSKRKILQMFRDYPKLAYDIILCLNTYESEVDVEVGTDDEGEEEESADETAAAEDLLVKEATATS